MGLSSRYMELLGKYIINISILATTTVVLLGIRHQRVRSYNCGENPPSSSLVSITPQISSSIFCCKNILSHKAPVTSLLLCTNSGSHRFPYSTCPKLISLHRLRIPVSLPATSHTTMENFDKSPSLFAIMTPVDNAARDAFSQVAQKMREDKGWNPHARQNIDANEKPVQVSTYGDESESDNGTEPPKKYRPVLKGCYTFDLKIPPKSPALGWTIGGGRFGKDNESPEILLTEKKLKAGVSARHARLAHNFTSGALVISALDSKNIRVNGHKLVDGQCMIYSRTTSLTFGSLMYSLEVRRYPTDDRYRDDLRIYKETHGIPEDEYPSNIRATTAETDIVTERYVLRNPIGRGATSIVYAAHKRGNGDAVVVKKIMRTAMNAKFIARDIDISKFIGEHVGISPQRDNVWLKHNRDGFVISLM